jgi:hypothetical protein
MTAVPKPQPPPSQVWHRGEVVRLERLANSVDGNPRWRVCFTEGAPHTTKPDAGFVYGMSAYLTGPVEFQLDGRGHISDLRVLDRNQPRPGLDYTLTTQPYFSGPFVVTVNCKVPGCTYVHSVKGSDDPRKAEAAYHDHWTGKHAKGGA